MKKRKVIPRKFIPVRPPVTATGFHIFLLYYFSAPGWTWGVYLTLAAIIWPFIIVGVLNQKEDDKLINNDSN